MYRKTCITLPEMGGGGRTFVPSRRSVFHHGPCWIMGEGIESGPMDLINCQALNLGSWRKAQSSRKLWHEGP